jgi:UDP-glucose 4-epimerase
MIAITGASGFIGSNFLKRYKGEYISIDLRKKIDIPNGVDTVIHLAGISRPYISQSDPAMTFKVNVAKTVELLEEMRLKKVSKIIFASSILCEYPGCNYGQEKLITERYIKLFSSQFGINYVIMRISGVYGEGMNRNPVYEFLSNGEVNLYVSRHSVYNFIYIGDVVNAIIRSLKQTNETLNIYGKDICLNHIYEYYRDQLNERPALYDTSTIKRIQGVGDWPNQFDMNDQLIKIYNYEREKRMDKPV